MNRLRGLFSQVRRLVSSATPSIPLDSVNAARFLYFHRLLQQTRDVPGAVVECGVGRGYSLSILALICKLEADPRPIWGLDSFEGLPEPTEEDRSPRNPLRGELATQMGAVDALTRAVLQDEQYHRSHLTLVKGFFEETLRRPPFPAISFLHIDVDIYQSYRTCLERLYPILSPDGIVAFDEYIREAGAFPGAQQAIDEFFAPLGITFERDPYYGKHYAVKP